MKSDALWTHAPQQSASHSIASPVRVSSFARSATGRATILAYRIRRVDFSIACRQSRLTVLANIRFRVCIAARTAHVETHHAIFRPQGRKRSRWEPSREAGPPNSDKVMYPRRSRICCTERVTLDLSLSWRDLRETLIINAVEAAR